MNVGVCHVHIIVSIQIWKSGVAGSDVLLPMLLIVPQGEI